MIEGSKVLLVDDNEEVIDILTDFLTLNGCGIVKASTGSEALGILSNQDIDIVILDVRLPDTNGISLLDKIKVENPTVGVIMITGYHDPNLIVEAMKKGASDFLMKPFEFDKLILVMMRVVRERGLLVEKESILSCLEDKQKIEMLNRELNKKIEELTTMYHISNKFNTLNILDDVYEKMIQIIGEVLKIRQCAYYIVDDEANELILYKELTNGHGPVHENKLPLTPSLAKDSSINKRYFQKDDRIFLPLLIKGERIGFISVHGTNGGGRRKHFLDSDIFFLRLITEKASTQIENRMLYESLFEGVLHTLTSLIEAINKRDLYTEGHCMRVTKMSLALGDSIGITDYERDVIRVVCPVHDLGKIGIPDAILLKPEKLTGAEYALMKNHSIHGEDIMNRFEILSNEAKVIRHHHERYDGQGYPDALSGGDIPRCSRIIAVCDTFDAMVTDRPYRDALSKDQALAEIRRCKGTQFDPDLADCFLKMVGNESKGRI
jgi:response regulator RpfG family c-di-GMP phosphodiesterase